VKHSLPDSHGAGFSGLAISSHSERDEASSAMALPPLSLSVFLSAAKVALKTSIKNRSPITFVIGNESAGLQTHNLTTLSRP